MNLDSLETLEQIEEFLSGTQPVAFGIASTKQERYDWLQKTLIKWRYQTRSRRARGLLMRFMARVSGYTHPPN